jgi:hypothetical protein
VAANSLGCLASKIDAARAEREVDEDLGDLLDSGKQTRA